MPVVMQQDVELPSLELLEETRKGLTALIEWYGSPPNWSAPPPRPHPIGQEGWVGLQLALDVCEETIQIIQRHQEDTSSYAANG